VVLGILAQGPWTGQGIEVILVPCCSVPFLLIGGLVGAGVAKKSGVKNVLESPLVPFGGIGGVIGGWAAFLPIFILGPGKPEPDLALLYYLAMLFGAGLGSWLLSILVAYLAKRP
jgi:hypothetical protein